MMRFDPSNDPVALVQEIADRYFSHASSRVEPDELTRWRPRASAWSLLGELQRLMPGARVRDTQVEGHRIRHLELGKSGRPVVVLLHGFGASKENWLSMALRLSRHYHLLMPDLPGFGASSFRPESRYTYTDQARRMAHWYSRLGHAPGHWVGSSMGGAIAGVVAAQHGHVAASVTLMNAAGVAGLGRSALEVGLMKGENVLIPSSFAEVQRLFRLTTHRNKELWSILMSPLLAQDMVQRASVKRRLFEEMLRPEVPTAHLLPSVQCPTLVLWGDRDHIIDVCCTDVFQTLIPHAQVEVFRNVGHLPMIEAPARTARTLHRFWRDVQEQPG